MKLTRISVFTAVLAVACLSRGAVMKRVLDMDLRGPNLIRPAAWGPWEEGFELEGGVLHCDNGADTQIQRGAGQRVDVNQTVPAPVVATAWSRAEDVTGGPNADYSLYLDIVYADGEPKWGQIAPFSTGTHDWEKRQVMFVPEKPIKVVSCYVLLRRHGGAAWFRDVEVREVKTPEGAVTFDTIPVKPAEPRPGIFIRDVKEKGDFLDADSDGQLGLKVETLVREERGARWFDVTVTDTTDTDRALTVGYTLPMPEGEWLWLRDAGTAVPAAGNREFLEGNRFSAGVNGMLSKYPLGAVANGQRGSAICVDLFTPAFHRIGFAAPSRELYLSYDIALTPERPAAQLRFCTFSFDPKWGFRAAVDRMMDLFPEAFACRTPNQGVWMPFAKISQVEGWEDFGFRFKEGNNETAWDDAHKIITFRYTEPMTWWMKMPKGTPRTPVEALRQATEMAEQNQNPTTAKRAQALLTSGFHDENGQIPARLRDTPWCDGAVWSMNSMPGIHGDVTDFNLKWNPDLKEKLYGESRTADLDGEYVDSSEGYVTDELDYRRDHFGGATTPLTFATHSLKPAIFRGLIAFEYVRGIERDIHAMGKLMMANSTPSRLWWLAPFLDVMGTETNWKRGDQYSPMARRDLLYRRTLCGPKPFCFLMNTNFEQFSHAEVEAYMKRCLAYGMFPGFFSHNASEGHYFTRPDLYNRDRPLFKTYVPLCKTVAEAGWQPVTRVTSANPAVTLERFGNAYLTVYNDSDASQTATLSAPATMPETTPDIVSGHSIAWKRNGEGATATVTLPPGDVAVLAIAPK
jgi:hypothetical protein